MTANTTLQKEFKKYIKGECFFDPLSRWLYSTDASIYQIEPLGVIIPRDADDVVTSLEIASQQGISLIARGGGTSLSGQGIGEGIILDVTKYLNEILEINVKEKWARVQAGVLLDQLNNALLPHGLMVGPDPSSSAAATIGGMTANNSTGAHSISYGMMIDHVVETEVVLSDGSIVNFKPQNKDILRSKINADSYEGRLHRTIQQMLQQHQILIGEGYPKTWRNVAGYNLNRLLRDKNNGQSFNLAPLMVGSEGTLAPILSVKVGLLPRPKFNHLTLLHFDSLYEALSVVTKLLTHHPSSIELLDKYFVELTRQNEEFGRKLNFIHGNPAAVQIVEFSGDEQITLQEKAAEMIDDLQQAGFSGHIVECSDSLEIANVWQVRKAGLGLIQSKRGDAKPLAFVDDAAVPEKHLAEYAENVIKICQKAGTDAAFYAHSSAGCLHINPMINLKTNQGMKQLRSISEAVIELAIQYGGTSTGEHGEGIARSYYNDKVYGPDLHRLFRELKGLFDPQNIFNPGKIVDSPLPWDPQLLRFNPDYQTPQTISETIFDFSKDGGFSGLVEMCNGQGSCRKLDAGVMCPSFMATQDEAYSTRGRANALRAAITGNLGPNGLDDDQLYDILSLCLACKGCKHECPSLVDMAKLKYEYLAQYQERNGIPLRSRLFGHIALMNRFTSIFPNFSNAAMSSRFIRYLMQHLLGVDIRRSMPRLASKTFQKWFHQRMDNRHLSREKVIFWDDTFLSYNEPEIGRAAVAVLESVGFEVIILKDRKCCGRPMISKGLLKEAKKNAIHNVKLLLPYVKKGISIVGVEPGCISMFRDEYLDLLSTEEAKLVAQQSFLIEEFLINLAEKGKLNLTWKESSDSQDILVHGHCYQKAMNGMQPLLKMFKMIPGATVEEIDCGCCGMAGSFGYEKEHYDISMKCGEDRLFPKVRQAPKDCNVSAAGTSCRHQILDGTGRKAEHPILLFAKALLGAESDHYLE